MAQEMDPEQIRRKLRTLEIGRDTAPPLVIKQIGLTWKADGPVFRVFWPFPVAEDHQGSFSERDRLVRFTLEHQTNIVVGHSARLQDAAGQLFQAWTFWEAPHASWVEMLLWKWVLPFLLFLAPPLIALRSSAFWRLPEPLVALALLLMIVVPSWLYNSLWRDRNLHDPNDSDHPAAKVRKKRSFKEMA